MARYRKSTYYVKRDGQFEEESRYVKRRHRVWTGVSILTCMWPLVAGAKFFWLLGKLTILAIAAMVRLTILLVTAIRTRMASR